MLDSCEDGTDGGEEAVVSQLRSGLKDWWEALPARDKDLFWRSTTTGNRALGASLKISSVSMTSQERAGLSTGIVPRDIKQYCIMRHDSPFLYNYLPVWAFLDGDAIESPEQSIDVPHDTVLMEWWRHLDANQRHEVVMVMRGALAVARLLASAGLSLGPEATQSLEAGIVPADIRNWIMRHDAPVTDNIPPDDTSEAADEYA